MWRWGGEDLGEVTSAGARTLLALEPPARLLRKATPKLENVSLLHASCERAPPKFGNVCQPASKGVCVLCVKQ